MNTDQLRERLSHKLMAQRPAMETADRYYSGTQPLKFLDPEINRVLAGRVQATSANFARLAIDVVAQRLVVTGFRSSPGEIVDRELMALWQRNAMDEQSQLAQTESLITGRAFFLVWAGSDGAPRITAESPMAMVVERDPATSEIVAAYKRWADYDGYTRSLLITADEVVEFVSKTASNPDPLYARTAMTIVADDATVARREPNPLGLVPVVALVTRPRLGQPDGISDIADLLGLIDGTSKTITDALVASEYSASPRRWVTGLLAAGERGLDAHQAQEAAAAIREQWEKAHASKILLAPSPTAKFGSFDVAPMTNYGVLVELLISQIGALASLPPHYISGNTANPTSADAIRSSESRLVQKIKQRQKWYSGAYESLMRISTIVATGVADPRLDDLETIWASPEPSTVAMAADAEVKLLAANITDRRAALESLGKSPQEIDRIITDTPNGAVIA